MPAADPCVCLDFEYRDEFDAAQHVCCVAWDGAVGARHDFDLRSEPGRAALRAFAEARARSHVWVAYAAMAEMSGLLAQGIDIRPMRWVDLLPECHMVTGTHRPLFVPANTLLAHLHRFEVRERDPEAEARKEAMRTLILSRDAYADEEFRTILDYCWSDVEPLPDLLAAVVAWHTAQGPERSPWERDHALNRGEYVKARAVLAARSPGIPVDRPWLRRIHDHRRAIRNRIAEECNRHYGAELYARKLTTVSTDPATRARTCAVEYAASDAGLEAFLSTQPFYDAWKRTATGRLKRDDAYLKELVRAFPVLEEWKSARNALQQLKGDGLVKREKDGFVRGVSLPFHTRTGRDQPKPSLGFVFGLAPWYRSVIRPAPGRALIGCDWSKQEPGIAAALSGDEKLIAAYNSRDLYLTMAEMAGRVPPGADPADHPAERKLFKSLVLGLSYGMQAAGLARSLAAGQRLTEDEAGQLARDLMAWHYDTFAAYWRWIDDEVADARARGWTASMDGWLYYVDWRTRLTQLLNLPFQSNGAVMLREATKEIAFGTGLEYVAGLHDAIYVACDEADAERTAAELRAVMDRAAERVTGGRVRIKIDTAVYTHAKPYRDQRGAKMLAAIEGLIADIEAGGAPPDTEVVERRKPRRAA